MHHDIDKNRVEHVQMLEQKLQAAMRMIQDIQSKDRWAPKIGIQMEGENCNITMEYCGKRKTLQVKTEVLRVTRPEDITSQITQAFLGDLIFDGVRTAIEQPVAQVLHQLQASANITQSTLSK